jgi:uncharacterized membrane protein YbaN (DUF454 family)
MDSIVFAYCGLLFLALGICGAVYVPFAYLLDVAD